MASAKKKQQVMKKRLWPHPKGQQHRPGGDWAGRAPFHAPDHEGRAAGM